MSGQQIFFVIRLNSNLPPLISADLQLSEESRNITEGRHYSLYRGLGKVCKGAEEQLAIYDTINRYESGSSKNFFPLPSNANDVQASFYAQ